VPINSNAARDEISLAVLLYVITSFSLIHDTDHDPFLPGTVLSSDTGGNVVGGTAIIDN
jgi:hypothetical protein